MKQCGSKYSALICSIATLIFLSLYYIDIFSWSGVTISGGHNSASYIFINASNDLGSYMENAKGLIDGTWPSKPFFRAPLYSFFLAACLAISDSIAWVAFVQIIFTAGIVFLLCKISHILFNKKTGTLATIMLMLYGGFVFITVVLHTAIMEVFFAILAFYALTLLRKNFICKNAIFAAITAALAGLIRPNYLLICPLAIIFAYIEYLFNHPKLQEFCKNKGFFSKIKRKEIISSSSLKNLLLQNKSILIKPFLLLITFFIILSPFVIWNNLHSDKLIFLTTNADITWRQSNSFDSHACGINLVPKKPLMPVSSLAFWKHQLLKTNHYLKSYEVPQNVNYYIFLYYSTFLKFLSINFGFISALFFASLWYYYRDWKKLWPILFYTIGFGLTIIAFNITGRYRLPTVPLMLIPVAAMLIDIWTKRNTQNKKRVIITSAIFIAFFLFSEPWRKAENFNSWGNQARRSILALNLKEYQYCVSKMYEINPYDRNVRMTLATSSGMVGEFDVSYQILKNENALYKNDKYLIKTNQEFDLYKKSINDNNPTLWINYIKNNKNLGHLGGQYKLYLNNISKRNELGLTVDKKNQKLLKQFMP